ncbi:MAG: isomerizing glutamine--fructose-6-phosphate transaminase, partial [Sphingomonadaceae bacterium]
MCGIVGILGEGDVAQRLVNGLKRLEYRGYDSAGICLLQDGQFARRRAEGKLANLEQILASDPIAGATGIAHTRWATHGRPNEANAHPHIVGDVAVVHNGIIENFRSLREALEAEGRHFESETDTEIVGHLIARELEAGQGPEAAVRNVLPLLQGAFALVLLFRSDPDLLIGARLGAPLTIGFGDGEMYLGSDALALSDLTQDIAYLEEGDWVVLRRSGATIFDRDNRPASRPRVRSGLTGGLVEKGNYRHFMLKEIHEQPLVVAQTLQSYLKPLEGRVALPLPEFDLASVERVAIVACGTAAYVGMIGKYWCERFARVPVDVDVASE